MNNKGFMMAEVIVVSSIILVTLTALYTSYNKIIAAYNQRIDYYDITTLYELSYIQDTNSLTGKSLGDRIYYQNNKTVYYTNKNNMLLLKSITGPNELNQTFKDYLDFIHSSKENDPNVTSDTRFLVMERCIDDDNCKYAYLEVD